MCTRDSTGETEISERYESRDGESEEAGEEAAEECREEKSSGAASWREADIREGWRNEAADEWVRARGGDTALSEPWYAISDVMMGAIGAAVGWGKRVRLGGGGAGAVLHQGRGGKDAGAGDGMKNSPRREGRMTGWCAVDIGAAKWVGGRA
jgi:hypothetical protein